jgi:hypothetical protein
MGVGRVARVDRTATCMGCSSTIGLINDLALQGLKASFALAYIARASIWGRVSVDMIPRLGRAGSMVANNALLNCCGDSLGFSHQLTVSDPDQSAKQLTQLTW